MNKEAISRADPQHYLDRGKRLARHVWEHFLEDRSFEEAASLGYTSLLSMVPLLAVVFGIVAAFPVFSEWTDRLQAFIFDNFLPETGEVIVPYINVFLESVSGLTLPGTITLIVTALLLMVRIEVALNRVWRVERSRTLVNRIVMYWAVLTLGPILIAAAVALGASNLSFLGDESGPPAWFTRIGMFALTWLVFSLFFLLVPNRRVRIKHALIGALLSTVLFELAKWGFVAYVKNANYKVIYGALATVPIFLFWLYIVWTVVLLGASLAASLTTFSDFRRYDSDWPERWEFQLAYRLVGHLWAAQREGRSLARDELMGLEPGASDLQISRLLSGMREARILASDEEGTVMLARDLEDLTLGDLYRLGDYYLPLGDTESLPRESAADRAYVDCLAAVREKGEVHWSRSLRSMYLNADEEEKDA